MKPALSILHVVVFIGVLLSGCSALREAVLGRENPLAPLDNVSLGRTSRAEVIARFGAPDEINERRSDTYSTEVVFYYDQDENENGYPELKVLSCEFSKGILTGYLFQAISDSRDEAFGENAHGKLTKGRTTRRQAEEVLGTPNGRSLIPTTLNLNSLGGQIGGVPVPLGKTPDDAKEVWLYNAQSLDREPHRPKQWGLAVFFDDKGTYLESVGLQQIIGKLP